MNLEELQSLEDGDKITFNGEHTNLTKEKLLAVWKYNVWHKLPLIKKIGK